MHGPCGERRMVKVAQLGKERPIMVVAFVQAEIKPDGGDDAPEGDYDQYGPETMRAACETAWGGGEILSSFCRHLRKGSLGTRGKIGKSAGAESQLLNVVGIYWGFIKR